MEANLERLMKDIETVASFNSTPGNGYTRFSYSEEDRKARNYLIEQMKQIGLSISVDAVGNIRARYAGIDRQAKPVLIGSHIDTVLHGGKYDGLLGVASSIEAIRVIKENRLQVKHPIEVIIFTEEEGSNFGSATAGSKSLVGKYNVNNLKSIKNDSGQSMYDIAKGFGLEPDKLGEFVIKPGDVKAIVELHIEQSVVLDSEKIPIGIVEAIAGLRWVKVSLDGLSNHAGATPMHLRKDPMVGAAKVIERLERITVEKANKTTVCTVGRIHCRPNIPNAIPETVQFTVDIRDTDPRGIEIVYEELLKTVEDVKKEHNLSAKIEIMGELDSIRLSERVVDLIEEVAKNRGVKYKRMNSGAVHDVCLFGDLTDVGMIFVPSIDGRSHVPEEDTSIEDIKTGCDLLIDVVLRLANTV